MLQHCIFLFLAGISLQIPQQLHGVTAGGNATLTDTTSSQTGTFYVALNGNDSDPGTLAQPFLTIDKARQVVRGLNGAMTGDIIVYIRAGEYFLPSTLKFDQLDSGTNGHHITYRAYPGEKPNISGGQKITGWTSLGGGIYKASVPSSLQFRQLYVNDTRATRARTPKSGSYNFLTSWDETNKRLVIPSDQLPTMPGGNLLNKVEMVIQAYGGVDAKLRIASITTSGSNAYITPMEPERTRVFAQSPYPPHKDNRPYVAENYMHDISQAVNGGYANNGIFLDEGSNHMSVKDNVCENIPEGCVRLSKTVGGSNAVANNKTVPPGDKASQAIIDNAGLESAYEDIRLSVLPAPSGSSEANSTPAQSQTNHVETSTPVISATSATAIYTFTRDLTVGSRGDDVTALQNILISGGHLAADNNTGYFGPLTRAALVSFQRANSITPALGYFGSRSRAKLNGVGGQ